MSLIPQNWLDLAALVDPSGHRPDPLAEGRPLDWYGIYALATAQLIAPTLHAELVKSGRNRLVPNEVQDALQELHRLNEDRNNRQRFVLRDTVRILNAHGIEPLVMKGAITLLPSGSATPATRMMSDIDIALVDTEPERGADALLAAGYWHADGQGPATYSRHHHLAPLFHPNGHGYVEIHRTIMVERVPPAALALAEVCAAAERVEWDGLLLRVPSTEHRLLHSALHHQVQDEPRSRGGYSLRQILEFVQLRESEISSSINWAEHLERLDQLGLGDALRANLILGQSLFAQPLPPGIDIGRAVHRSERVTWYWQTHPRQFRLYQFSRRLRRLPAKLVTPSWYPQKYRQLRSDVMTRRPRR